LGCAGEPSDFATGLGVARKAFPAARSVGKCCPLRAAPAVAASVMTTRVSTHETRRRGRLRWDVDGLDWPHRASSRFVDVEGIRWHVQVMGQGPAILLVHGTGAASHSWRGMAPLLARQFTVVMPDLPGHGFTDPLPHADVSLPGFAHALAGLVRALALPPTVAVGHSAGAAVLARMCLDGAIAPRALVSLNGALLPPSGWAGLIFMPAARLLALNPLVPYLFSWRAGDPRAVARLIDSTGSTLDAEGAALYARLIASPQHVAGTLAMMARWDLRPLVADLPRLVPALTLVVGEADRTVAPREARLVQQRLGTARIVSLAGLGHLAHEEAPQRVAELVIDCARRAKSLQVS
jgi:magnesium chelatase accessory protein